MHFQTVNLKIVNIIKHHWENKLGVLEIFKIIRSEIILKSTVLIPIFFHVCEISTLTINKICSSLFDVGIFLIYHKIISKTKFG